MGNRHSAVSSASIVHSSSPLTAASAGGSSSSPSSSFVHHQQLIVNASPHPTRREQPSPNDPQYRRPQQQQVIGAAINGYNPYQNYQNGGIVLNGCNKALPNGEMNTVFRKNENSPPNFNENGHAKQNGTPRSQKSWQKDYNNNTASSPMPNKRRTQDETGRIAPSKWWITNLFGGKKAKMSAADDASTIKSSVNSEKARHHHSIVVNGKQIQADEITAVPDRAALRVDVHQQNKLIETTGVSKSMLVCKYEVISVIGKGSFSQVLRVKHRLTGEFYAVKLVSINDQDFGAVNNELSILSHVEHENVIRLEEVFRSPLKLFIVMEMASGGEMYDRVVNKGRFTEIEARASVQMLLKGLCYLHRKLITHRDLKPENLLYSDSSDNARLLITDFGLANERKTPDEKMTETCGTPEYIAPEILLRIPYTNKVDMWAVGVITYILMSGIMPFDDDCRSRLYTHIITANYVYYPQYWSGSDPAKEFVDTLLETNAGLRMSSDEALRHHWITGEPPNNGYRKSSRIEEDTESKASVQRTKSSRSIRSVTRSDHCHRVDPSEVDKLAEDLQKLADKQRKERERYQQKRDDHRSEAYHYLRDQNHRHSSNGATTNRYSGSSSSSQRPPLAVQNTPQRAVYVSQQQRQKPLASASVAATATSNINGNITKTKDYGVF